jgi:uncharacterized protein YhbP (UPF0306 family)
MADLKHLLQDHLKTARVMQLATAVDNKPWACTVHFYSDDDLNIYWMSTPIRRHSQEIEKNPFVAAAIKIHEDTPSEQYIIGIAVEGKAALINESETKRIGELYVKKLGKPEALIEDILAGRNPHKFYRLEPTSIVLFDTKNFSNNPRQEYTV